MGDSGGELGRRLRRGSCDLSSESWGSASRGRRLWQSTPIHVVPTSLVSEGREPSLTVASADFGLPSPRTNNCGVDLSADSYSVRLSSAAVHSTHLLC